jgi:ABC-type multidrug transport system permease subunit
MNWYPIFLREILIFERRLLRLGYVVSAFLMPLLYLLAFGLGLGRRVNISGGSYLNYLLPGLIAMSSMINAYTWVANGLTMGRLYFQTFQVYVQAPVSAAAIVWGEVASGIVRGLLSSLILLILGVVIGSGLNLNLLFLLSLVINCLLFSAMGVVVGMRSKTHEDTANFSNFFIMPMAFFSGTFFPIKQMPWVLQAIVTCLPLTHTNYLLRYPFWDLRALASLGVLLAYSVACLALAIFLVQRYSE